MDFWPPQAKLIQVDIKGDHIGLIKLVNVGIEGDATLVSDKSLPQLTPGLQAPLRRLRPVLRIAICNWLF